MARPEREVFNGPTAERLIHSMGSLMVGDDKQGTKVYHFTDSALERVYEHLNAHSENEDDRARNAAELRALMKYGRVYVEGGMNGSMRSVDLGNACLAGGAGRDHAAKGDYQVDCRAEFIRANYALTENQRTVARIVVLEDCSLEQAGRALGKLSRRRAIQSGRDILRNAGFALGELWNFL